MDDLDLLVDPERSREACERLVEGGFRVRPSIGGRQHEDLLGMAFDGVDVAVEVHHRALWNQTDQVLPNLWDRAVEVPGLGGARMAEPTVLLWQVFHHAFRSQIHWVPYRLIWVADLVGSMERFGPELDARRLRREHRTMARSLPLLDGLTPLPEPLRSELGRPWRVSQVGRPYTGWPRRPLRREGRLDREVLAHTVWPGGWWLGMRYGWGTSPAATGAAWIEHAVSLITHAW